MLFITKRRVGTDMLSCGKFGMKRSLNFTAGVLCKPFVEQVFEWYEIGKSFFGVLIVRDSDIADILLREHEFQIVVHHNVFTTETG